MIEKRGHARVAVQLDIALENESGERFNGAAKDVSLGGMYIESEVPQEFGKKLTIVTRLPGMPGDSRLPAVVRWSKPGGFGVQFGLLGARDTHALTELLRHH